MGDVRECVTNPVYCSADGIASGKVTAGGYPAGALLLLPALQRPTISSLSDSAWVAVNTVIDEKTVRDLIPRLKLAGGQGIVEYPLNKIVV